MDIHPLCIVKLFDGQILGWIIAMDINEASLKARAIGNGALADRLGAMEPPRSGKYDLGNNLMMLVD